jgi:hypothetical protein
VTKEDSDKRRFSTLSDTEFLEIKKEADTRDDSKVDLAIDELIDLSQQEEQDIITFVKDRQDLYVGVKSR